MKKIFALSLFIIFISSCYKDMDLDKYRKSPLIVLNCVASPDTFVMANVSKTWFFTEGYPTTTKIVEAKVDLYINGEYKEQMSKADSLYISTIKPNAGDIIKVIAATDSITVWAEDTIPPKTEIESVETSNQEISKYGGTYTQIKYRITFQDDASHENYYFIRIENKKFGVGRISYFSTVFLEQTSAIDGVINNEEIEGNGGRTFSDELINGQRHTLILSETEYYPGAFSDLIYHYPEYKERRIILYSLSKSYYNYLTCLVKLEDQELSGGLIDMDMAEPTKVFSNINGGTGILGLNQHSIVCLNLDDILK